ncbi:polysaccharide lyase family 1 protein [Natronosporangium hydrolyticum]|uniref:Polysaccharide lyase family 1 protein n=1 Tax=Natronosporangium hydrolyticum TaxID=2811111 RepID=A0A895YKC7_9ACTN|nr:polysaccharide lyase family 1 protein [Natronosporangium hydrolyticum]QSB15773.1 polysaccharide lyase family 1 protein [Natronosporangium hydrolyticum]
MTSRRWAATLAATALAAGVAVAPTLASGPAAAAPPAGGPPLTALGYGKQTLPTGDGWGSAGGGTTGGSAATADQIHIATDRASLIEALGGDNATNAGNDVPKVVFVKGTIDGFEGPDGELLDCQQLADPAYDFDEYLAAYDPAVWGWQERPHGPLAEARERSMRNQEAQTVINVGPNTTIIGLDRGTLTHLTLMVNNADNVILRNLTFRDAYDCFPAWDPLDGASGNWNSNWDQLSVRRSENVWIDHNSFLTSPDDLPEYFGRKFEVYDGQLDITHTADLVTVSHNIFRDHDKMMLIGSTNNPDGGDPGRLNVTLRHNVFDGIGQRAPRMRFGKIDVYNNLFRVAVTANSFDFEYLWGVGVESQGYYENNYLDLRGSGVDPAEVIYEWGGTDLTEHGSWVRTGPGIGRPMSLLAAYNAGNDPPLGDDVGWTPQLRRGPVLPAPAVAAVVPLAAGAGKLPFLG